MLRDHGAAECILGGNRLADPGLALAPLCCVRQMMSWVRCSSRSEILHRKECRDESIEGTIRGDKKRRGNVTGGGSSWEGKVERGRRLRRCERQEAEEK